MGKILRLVLTGGPCAGKTTAIERLTDLLNTRGYCVLRIPESATLSKDGGIQFSLEMAEQAQRSFSTIQRNNEDVFIEFARDLARVKDVDVVVLMDRGIIDGGAYVPEEEFNGLLCSLGLENMQKTMERYDLVFFLESAAVGAEKFYVTSETRHESLEEAIEVNRNTYRVWKSHKNMKIFDNIGKSFEKKMREIVTELCNHLEIPVTMKIPQRYIVRFFPDKVPSGTKLAKFDVEKVFVSPNTEILSRADSHDEKEFSFVRKISSERGTSFVLKTVRITAEQQIETKEHLTERQYNLYMRFADTKRQKVVQTRFYFTLDSVKFEICRYEGIRSEWKEPITLLNIFRPISEPHKHVALPDFLETIKDVTRDFKYSSHYLSLVDRSTPYQFEDLYSGESVKCRIVQGEFDYE